LASYPAPSDVVEKGAGDGNRTHVTANLFFVNSDS
jgi:hypothetical protein